MNEKTLTYIALAIGAYVFFIHNGGVFSMVTTGNTAATPAPPPAMPSDTAGEVGATVRAGFDLIKSIFDSAGNSATATRGSGVSNA